MMMWFAFVLLSGVFFVGWVFFFFYRVCVFFVFRLFAVLFAVCWVVVVCVFLCVFFSWTCFLLVCVEFEFVFVLTCARV